MADRPHQIIVGDGTRADGNPSRHPVGRQLAAGGGHGHALDIEARDILGALDSLGDGLGGFVEVDDGAPANTARLHIANAGGRQGPIAFVHAVGLHDEAGDLGRAEIDGGDDRLANQGGLEAILAITGLGLERPRTRLVGLDGLAMIQVQGNFGAASQLQHPSDIHFLGGLLV